MEKFFTYRHKILLLAKYKLLSDINQDDNYAAEV